MGVEGKRADSSVLVGLLGKVKVTEVCFSHDGSYGTLVYYIEGMFPYVITPKVQGVNIDHER